jgi:hypothetical protein
MFLSFGLADYIAAGIAGLIFLIIMNAMISDDD